MLDKIEPINDVDPYEFIFDYPKKDLNDNAYFSIDYDRFRELLSKYPYHAFELALFNNAIDINTGLVKQDYEQISIKDYLEWQLIEFVDLMFSFDIYEEIEPVFLQVLTPLLQGNNVKPLLGKDWEWIDVSCFSGAEPGTKFQNRRFSSIFKDGKDGEAYWVDGKVFSDDGKNWCTRDGGMSNVPITFPCITHKLEKQHIIESQEKKENFDESA